LFGAGQVIFAIGFGIGGFHGLSRKAYGAEQHLRSLGEWIGIGVMSAGGLVAVAGGLLFLLLAVCAARRRTRFSSLGDCLNGNSDRQNEALINSTIGSSLVHVTAGLVTPLARRKEERTTV
jgi:heme/copper-type cytochrome/quinol oxidase subunit 1